jgi:hypothetical protein
MVNRLTKEGDLKGLKWHQLVLGQIVLPRLELSKKAAKVFDFMVSFLPKLS